MISHEKGLAVPAVLAGAEDYYMLLSSQLTTSRTGRQAGAGWLAGWLKKLDMADFREIEIL